ncbi:MAG: cation-translocating P-type ATPase [Candidatus Paceibacterota bacterium]
MKNNLKSKYFFNFDVILFFALVISLIVYFFKLAPSPLNEGVLIGVGIVATLPVVFSAIRAIIKRKVSIDLLAGVALLVALVEREWFSVVFINLMITSARIFAYFVEMRSRSAIESLLKLKPQTATLEKNNKISQIPLEQIKINDKIIVELGESIPVDGVIEKGEALVNQASLTGESAPIFKKIGDKVLSSTVVSSGNITIRAEKIGKDTAFEKIIELVEKSQTNKARIENLGEKFTAYYILITVVVSIVIYFYSRDINLVLAILLVSCADDIAVAVPMALMTTITHSARDGAIIKGGNIIESLAKLKVIVFDKTGTLTTGKLKFKGVLAFNGYEEKEILDRAMSLSLSSHHPIAAAVAEYAREKNIKVKELKNFEEYLGKGMAGTLGSEKIFMGRAEFFNELEIKINSADLEKIKEEENNGYNVTLVAAADRIIGAVLLEDTVREGIKDTILRLRKIGIKKMVILTGDNEKVAEKISKEVGIHQYHANLLPEQKTEYLKKYLSKKYKVAMIGDGVNDAPCLALADVGIAMGVIGSDAAIDSADIAMMKDNLAQIPELVQLSKKTMAVIRQDFVIWGAVNLIGFVLVGMYILKPGGAAAYNFFTDFLPILNSLQLII